VFRQSGDTDAQAKARALEQMALIMNRVNGVYEREVSITMRLVGNQDVIIYTDPATDPYTNENGSAMLSQNQSNLDSVIGTANYDVGHVFSTGGGGVASLRVPCGSGKARGVTDFRFQSATRLPLITSPTKSDINSAAAILSTSATEVAERSVRLAPLMNGQRHHDYGLRRHLRRSKSSR
jgi:hypothetical protein